MSQYLKSHSRVVIYVLINSGSGSNPKVCMCCTIALPVKRRGSQHSCQQFIYKHLVRSEFKSFLHLSQAACLETSSSHRASFLEQLVSDDEEGCGKSRPKKQSHHGQQPPLVFHRKRQILLGEGEGDERGEHRAARRKRLSAGSLPEPAAFASRRRGLADRAQGGPQPHARAPALPPRRGRYTRGPSRSPTALDLPSGPADLQLRTARTDRPLPGRAAPGAGLRKAGLSSVPN